MSKPFKLSVKAVIFDASNRCLLIRRSSANHNFVDQWEWPGGKPDPGEDFTTALHREVREECGLEVEFAGLAGAAEFELPSLRVVLVCMTARHTGGEVRLSAEHDAFDWVGLEELTQRPILEPMKPVLKSLLERKETCV